MRTLQSTSGPSALAESKSRASQNGNGHGGNGHGGNGYGGNGYGGPGYGGNGYGGYGYGGYGYGGYGYSAQRGSDFSRTWHTLVERAWLIALTAVVSLALGYFYLQRAKVRYSATATIQAEQDQPNILKMQMVQLRDLQAVDYLQTVAQTLNSLPLLERVADTNHLWGDPRLTNTITLTTALRPSLLSADDFKDLDVLVAKLVDPQNEPVASFIWSQIPMSSQRQLRSPTLGLDQKRFLLADALNTILQSGSIYDPVRFGSAKLSSETKSLASHKLAGAELVRFNRMLLQEAFPAEIAQIGRGRVLAALDKMVKVKLRKGTRLIDITVTHSAPEITSLIANSIVAEYLNESAEREDTTIGMANKSLAKEAERLRKKLEESENALQAYKEQTKASSLDERQNTVVAKLKELSTKATEAKSARIKSETEYNQVVSLGTNIEALLTVPTIAKDPTVLALQLSLTKAEDDFAALCKRYKEAHPKYIQAKTQIGELGTDITNAVLSTAQTLKASLESAKAAEDALNQAMQAQEASAMELSKLSIQYGVLTREVESDRTLYDAVLKGMKEASVTKETQQTGVVRVVQPAYTPDLPIWPKKIVVMAASGLGGLFLGVLMIMAVGAADSSIKTVDEAERLLGLSVLSAVPQMKEIKKGTRPLVVAEMSRSEGAEAFRTLRAALTTLGDANTRRVFLFTSAMPSEGKTFCSINFSASLAQVGLKTLLIDADMRCPAVETGVEGQSSNTPGLTDYLLGQKSLSEVIRPTKVEGLSYISGGATAANPAELLAKGGMEGLIHTALEQFDRVIIDSAPINAVSDTLLMLKHVQTVCLVIHAARTSSRYVLRCAQLLQGGEAPLAGVILNKMPRRRRAGYNAYYDYSYHGKYEKAGVYGTP
jgi:capsular exopolysaccharide synthesis family protein